jgi:uncharacterized repeat protein (TIGR03803 family)
MKYFCPSAFLLLPLSSKSSRLLFAMVAVAAISFSLEVSAHAQTESVLYTFFGTEGGQYPGSTPVLDAAGNVYGTTTSGGLSTCLGIGCGIVFELSPSGTSWNFSEVHTFSGGADGSQPLAGMIIDSAGNLYATTGLGGNDHSCPVLGPGCGTVQEFSPSSNGTWMQKTLVEFNGAGTGWYPLDAVTMDAAGNLYGTTEYGGSTDFCNGENGGCGIVFKLSPNSSGGWTETVLHVFHSYSGDGYVPFSGVALDAAGNLYGTTVKGGASSHCVGFGCGIVYKLSPNSDGTWTETILHTFTGGNDGGEPTAGVVFDSKGNLYGAALVGGKPTACSSPGCGTIFEMSPKSNGSWSFHVIHTFTRSDGAGPWGTPVLDAKGNLYGTTQVGGDSTCNNGSGCGTVFKMSPSSTGWKFTTLHAFTNSPDGFEPEAGVALDQSGNIFGTTVNGGLSTGCCGTVFEIKP